MPKLDWLTRPDDEKIASNVPCRLQEAVSTTMDVYTHATPTRQRAAVERMAELVTNGDELPVWSVDSELENTCIQ